MDSINNHINTMIDLQKSIIQYIDENDENTTVLERIKSMTDECETDVLYDVLKLISHIAYRYDRNNATKVYSRIIDVIDLYVDRLYSIIHSNKKNNVIEKYAREISTNISIFSKSLNDLHDKYPVLGKVKRPTFIKYDDENLKRFSYIGNVHEHYELIVNGQISKYILLLEQLCKKYCNDNTYVNEIYELNSIITKFICCINNLDVNVIYDFLLNIIEKSTINYVSLYVIFKDNPPILKHFVDKRVLIHVDRVFACENNKDELTKIIENDDLPNFIKYCTAHNYNANTTFGYKINNDNTPIDLLSYAAYYGAYNIYMYLYEHGKNKKLLLLEYAIYGGNPKIIKFIEEHRSEMWYNESALSVCIETYNHNTLRRLLKEQASSYVDEVLYRSKGLMNYLFDKHGIELLNITEDDIPEISYHTGKTMIEKLHNFIIDEYSERCDKSVPAIKEYIHNIKHNYNNPEEAFRLLKNAFGYKTIKMLIELHRVLYYITDTYADDINEFIYDDELVLLKHNTIYISRALCYHNYVAAFELLSKFDELSIKQITRIYNCYIKDKYKHLSSLFKQVIEQNK